MAPARCRGRFIFVETQAPRVGQSVAALRWDIGSAVVGAERFARAGAGIPTTAGYEETSGDTRAPTVIDRAIVRRQWMSEWSAVASFR